MARGYGRGGTGPDVVVVTTRKFRSVDDSDPDIFPVSQHAHRIKSYAADDHDQLSRASRRSDANLMRDITSRLAQLNQQPLLVKSSHSRPVYTAAVPGSRRVVVIPSYSTSQRSFTRSSSVPPSPPRRLPSNDFTLFSKAAKRGYYYDIDDWFYPKPHVPHVRRHVRAGSEPPRGRLEDNYTGLLVRDAKRSLFRLERELGYDDWDVDEPIVRTTSVASTGALGRPFRGRSSSYVAPVTRSSRVRQLEEEWNLEPELPHIPQSLSSLRARTADARSKMDTHKVLLDRYLPLPRGPLPEVAYEIENKFGELAARSDKRMPSLMARRYSTGCMPAGYIPPVAPYRPAHTGPKVTSSSADDSAMNYNLRRPSARPPVSAARRNAREILCKTKNDPHYYD